MKRREFIRTSAIGILAYPAAAVLLRNSAFAADTEIVSLDNPTAKALGYVHDASAVDVSKWPKRAGEEGAKQFCSNCSFAVGEARAVEGQEGTWVGCQLFPGKLVASEGWCNSWAAKPA